MDEKRRLWTIGGGVLGVLLLSVAAYNYCRCYCGGPTRLSMSAGNVCPLRTEMASQIAASISGDVEVAVCEGTNSEGICQAVDDGKLDMGLVLGGLPSNQFSNVRQVATLGVEPLHLVVRREILSTSAGPSLEMLRGRHVSLGEASSNGCRLALDLLRLAGLEAGSVTKPADFEADYAPEQQLQAQAVAWRSASVGERLQLEKQLPDAVFIVDSMPSDLVDELVRHCDYQLVSLPFATALHLDSRRHHETEAGGLRNDRVEKVVIPAFSYGIHPAMPADDCETIGLRLLLVANEEASSDALRDALRSISDAVAQHAQIKLDVTNANPEFPVHPGAEAFLRARRPVNLDEILGPTTDALSVFGATIAGSLAIWGFVRGLRAVPPDVHMRQVQRVERLLHGNELDEAAPTLPREFLDYLESRLAQVKQAAIEDYTAGKMHGDEALVGILTLVADTRHLLAMRRKQLVGASPAMELGLVRRSGAA
jgi:TRAP-type uncharacterized transport system substrate-binding protein